MALPLSNASTKASHRAGDRLRLPKAADSAGSVLPITLSRTVLLNSTMAPQADSILDTASCDQCQESSPTTDYAPFFLWANHASKVVTTTSICSKAHWLECHDWTGHLHLRHQCVHFSNISRTPFIFWFPYGLAHRVRELRQDMINWPPVICGTLLGKHICLWYGNWLQLAHVLVHVGLCSFKNMFPHDLHGPLPRFLSWQVSFIIFCYNGSNSFPGSEPASTCSFKKTSAVFHLGRFCREHHASASRLRHRHKPRQSVVRCRIQPTWCFRKTKTWRVYFGK